MSSRIIVLDGYTTSPNQGDTPTGSDGDVSWDPIRALGDLTIYDRTPADDIAAAAGDAEFILTNKAVLSEKTIEALAPGLKYIGVLATGVNVVDLEAASKHDVVVTNVPGYSTESVAQHVFAMLLEAVNHIAAHDRAVHDGRWVNSPDFCFTVAPITELAGKTFGLVGLGAIGSQVAQIASAFGMRVVASRSPSGRQPEVEGVKVSWLEPDDVFRQSDVVSLHCPLTERTKNLINEARLKLMKPKAVLINTGRGPLIDEQALADALASGKLGFACLDVLSSEPPSQENPLLSAPRCIITPHTAWASVEARTRLVQIAADNIKAYQDGKPQNVVN